MLAYLKGIIIKKGANYIVLDVSNVGYKVFVGEKILSKKVKGDELILWTYQSVREDSLDLYGFTSEEELELFELLISISGIGPKSGLGVLAVASVVEIKESIASGDPHLLIKVSGIGKKTAERVVLELKDKMDKIGLPSGALGNGSSAGSDEIDALMSLGYNFQQAREALNKVDKSITDSGQRIREALKIIR